MCKLSSKEQHGSKKKGATPYTQIYRLQQNYTVNYFLSDILNKDIPLIQKARQKFGGQWNRLSIKRNLIDSRVESRDPASVAPDAIQIKSLTVSNSFWDEQLLFPYDLIQDTITGNIIVSDMLSGDLSVFSQNGRRLNSLANNLDRPGAIIKDMTGGFWIALTGSNQVLHINDKGSNIDILSIGLDQTLLEYKPIFLCDFDNHLYVSMGKYRYGKQVICKLNKITGKAITVFETIAHPLPLIAIEGCLYTAHLKKGVVCLVDIMRESPDALPGESPIMGLYYDENLVYATLHDSVVISYHPRIKQKRGFESQNKRCWVGIASFRGVIKLSPPLKNTLAVINTHPQEILLLREN